MPMCTACASRGDRSPRTQDEGRRVRRTRYRFIRDSGKAASVTAIELLIIASPRIDPADVRRNRIGCPP
jgi:hypothetical protein